MKYSSNKTNVSNRFLRYDDYHDILFKVLREEFERIYCTVMKGPPHPYGSKKNYITKMHWSRDWEYPWVVLYGEFKEGQKVLDCGCGGSPLLPFLALRNIETYGVDLTYGDNFNHNTGLKEIIQKYVSFLTKQKPSLGNLRFYYRDPSEIFGVKINVMRGDFTDLKYENNFFDRTCCVSTLEHMSKENVIKGIKEMVRVTKKGGLIILTVDQNGKHITKGFENSFQDIIKASGCKIHGNFDWTIPKINELPGTYNVVGFILEK